MSDLPEIPEKNNSPEVPENNLLPKIPEKLELHDVHEIYDKIVAHMNGKYDDKFTFRLPVHQRLGSFLVRINMNSEKYPGKKVYASCFRDEEDNVVITDNYVGIKFEKEVRDSISKMLTDMYGDGVLVLYETSATISSLKFDDKTSFEEFAGSKSACIFFNAIVYWPKDKFKQDHEDSIIKSKLIDSGICCSGTVYFTENKNLITGISESDSLGLALNSHPYYDRFDFLMSEKGVFFKSKWEA